MKCPLKFRKISVKTLVQFRMFRIQNWLVDVISKWLGMVLRGEAQTNIVLNQKTIKTDKQKINKILNTFKT